MGNYNYKNCTDSPAQESWLNWTGVGPKHQSCWKFYILSDFNVQVVLRTQWFRKATWWGTAGCLRSSPSRFWFHVCTVLSVSHVPSLPSWTKWLLHRLRGYQVVPLPRAIGGGHAVRPPSRCLGNWLCLCWAAVRGASVARKIRCGSALSDQENLG